MHSNEKKVSFSVGQRCVRGKSSKCERDATAATGCPSLTTLVLLRLRYDVPKNKEKHVNIILNADFFYVD